MPNAMKHQLDERGYCVVEGFLSPAETSALREETRQYPRLLKHQTSAECLVSWDGEDRIQQILHAEKLSPLLDRINRSDRAVALLHQVYGYDLGLYHSKFILKDGGGSEVPWHQDFSYWQRHSAHACQINCMVYLDDADEENGCLVVVPGSHRQGLVPHQQSSTGGAFSARLGAIDERAAMPLTGSAGTALIFGPLLYHASRANRTSRPRHSFTTVYTNPLIDRHREVIDRFFPIDRVKPVTGPGPFRFCQEHYQRRGLWQLAADHVANRDWPWIEITDRTYNDGSFEWLSARKPADALYIRFEELALVTSNREDVHVRSGRLTDGLVHLPGPCGLAFLDLARVTNAAMALAALRPVVQDGTILVLDNFYDTPDWALGVYRAFQTFIVDSGLGFDYLGRSPQQVAVRLTHGPACACPDVQWQPVSQGIAYG